MNRNLLIILMAALMSGSLNVDAQTVGIEYISELQTNFKGDNNYVNLLRLNAELPLSDKVRLRASTISSAKSNPESIANDIQTFSNIEIDNLALGLSIAAIEWDIDEHNSILAGVHHVNEDCFASDVTSLFTNSSCGIYPTLSSNYPIANYPVASLGIHFKHDDEHFGFVAALYNGVGYNHFWGRENAFRFCPNSDGIFTITQGEYKYRGSHYFLGACLHYGELDDIEGKKTRTSLWTYAEQKVSNTLTLIGGYSHAFHSSSYCRDFAGIGGKLDIGKAELGLFSDYAHFNDTDEWATELTCKFPLTEHTYLQPTIHFISQESNQRIIGLLRFGIEY